MRKFLVIAILLNFIYLAQSEEIDTLNPYLYLGAYGGLNNNLHNADFKELPGVPNCCPKFESGSGLGFHFGGLLRVPLNDNYSLGVNLGYITLNGSLQKDEIIGNTEIRNAVPPFETTDIVDAISNHSVDGKFSAITLEPRFIWHFLPNFRWNIGVNLGFLSTTQFSQREKLTSPNNIVFTSTGTTVRNEYVNQDLPEAQSFQIFGKTSLGYELKYGRNMRLVPEIGISYPFTNLYSGNWKVTPIYATLALEIPLRHHAPKDTLYEIKYYRDTTVIAQYNLPEEKINLITTSENLVKYEKSDHNLFTTEITEHYEKYISQFADLNGKISVLGMDDNGNLQGKPTITIEEIEVSESFPLLPYIFFKENSSDIQNISVYKRSSNFSYNDLPWETIGIYKNLFNIVKYRMDANPNAKIKLTGTNNNLSEVNNLTLSRTRAQNVKEYLVSTMNIPDNRIEIAYQNLPDKPSSSNTPEGIEENQRVEISSNDFEILAPVNLAQIEKKINPPVIQITPEVKSTLPITNWEIDVKQSNNIIRHFSGEGYPRRNLWILAEEPIPHLETPIDITFNAQDSLGNPLQLQNQVNITQKTIKKKREEILNDTTYQRFSLIVFDFDKSDLNKNHKRILDELQSKIEPNSTVSIYGYADKTGTSEYNKDLAGKRIDEIVKYMKLPAEKIKRYNIGSDEFIFDNNSPEGRSYSRTVKIIIATPIK
ncbi:MAG: hypothetical protein A2X64_09020 [Ignavibacteria bacterium GWF2_33_9]|nr:MAG: hypothetical protein A2X64_09020 [Ignavibacteria bacterium GWF2_33_9]